MYEDIVDEYRKERLNRKELRRYKTHSQYVANYKNGGFDQIWNILDIHKGTFVKTRDEVWESENDNRGMIVRALNKEFRAYNKILLEFLSL